MSGSPQRHLALSPVPMPTEASGALGVAPPARVAFIVEALTVGGAERILVDLANRCLARGSEVHMICLTARGALAGRLHEGVHLHVLDKRPRVDLRMARRLRRLIRRLEPQAINSHLWVGNFWTRVSLLGLGVPIVVTEHSRDNWKPLSYRLIDRCLAPFTRALIAVSEDTASFYRAEVGIRPTLVRVINNGIDTRRYAASDGRTLRARWIEDGELLIGTVGRLVTAKNHLRLLDMFERLRADGLERARLIIVGEGPERARLERRIAERELSDHVTLAGSRDDIPDVLAALDVFVLSSDREGHPLTALEAQAAGTPVVLTDAGGSRDAIADDGQRTGGFLVEPDAAALAVAVRRLADDPELRTRMGTFAQAYAMTHFDSERMVDAYLALLGDSFGRDRS